MLPAYIASQAAERRRAGESAEFARQLPLWQAEFAEPPPEYLERMNDGEDGGRRLLCRSAPDWTSNY